MKLFLRSVDLKYFCRLYSEKGTGYANRHNCSGVKLIKNILKVCQVLGTMTLIFFLSLDGLLIMLELTFEWDICVVKHFFCNKCMILLLTRYEVGSISII